MPRKRSDEPLFDARPFGGSGNPNVAALAKSLRAARQAGVLEPIDALRIRQLRNICEAEDDELRRPDKSLHSLATASRTVTELFNLLIAGADATDAFDDLVAALSAPPGDPEP